MSKTTSHSVRLPVTICKTDAKRRIVYAEVYRPGMIDTHGDMMQREDVTKMAHRWLSKKNLETRIDTQHDQKSNGSRSVESFVARKGDPDFSEDAWVLGVHIPEDDVWAKVENGELNGFSVEMLVYKQEIEVDVTVDPEHIFKTSDAADGHSHWAVVTCDAMGKIIGGVTSPGPDGHVHQITKGTATSRAEGHSHRLPW